jgi:hypothetical protein
MIISLELESAILQRSEQKEGGFNAHWEAMDKGIRYIDHS